MSRIKSFLRNVFMTVGLGTMIFVPMLIIDNGLNDTLKSVIIWLAASVLYGFSFELLRIRSKIKLPLHIAVCFIITISVRCIYSYSENGYINFGKIFFVTIPIFVGVYAALYLFMRYVGETKPVK